MCVKEYINLNRTNYKKGENKKDDRRKKRNGKQTKKALSS